MLCGISDRLLALAQSETTGLHYAAPVVPICSCSERYVSPAHFEEEDPFADFVVHEVAHIFHNCKRRSAGLPETRRKEWLLDIEFRKRETFAYACEGYARVLERSKKPTERVALAAELSDSYGTGDERVARGEIAEIVRSAAERRNGWKVILECSAPPMRPR